MCLRADMVSYTHLFLTMLFCWPSEGIRGKDSSVRTLFLFLSFCLWWGCLTMLPQGLTVGNSVPVPRCHFQLPTQTWDFTTLGGSAFPCARISLYCPGWPPPLPSCPAYHVLGSVGSPCWDSFSVDGCELPVGTRTQATCSARAGRALNHCSLTQPLPTHFYLHVCMILNGTLADPTALEHLIFV